MTDQTRVTERAQGTSGARPGQRAFLVRVELPEPGVYPLVDFRADPLH